MLLRPSEFIWPETTTLFFNWIEERRKNMNTFFRSVHVQAQRSSCKNGKKNQCAEIVEDSKWGWDYHPVHNRWNREWIFNPYLFTKRQGRERVREEWWDTAENTGKNRIHGFPLLHPPRPHSQQRHLSSSGFFTAPRAASCFVIQNATEFSSDLFHSMFRLIKWASDKTFIVVANLNSHCLCTHKWNQSKNSPAVTSDEKENWVENLKHFVIDIC